MIHAVIFANRENGNQLYERTPGFPADAAAGIFDLCNSLRVSAEQENTSPVLRYQPLDDRYLLSVIQRVAQGNESESRAHVICVNFLLDEQDADRFFGSPFPDAANAALSAARELLAFRRERISPALCEPLTLLPDEDTPPKFSATPLPVLLTGVSYALDRSLTKQLFLETTCSPLDELNNLFRILPPPLRKQLSFHTGCISAQECRNLAICYCQGNCLEDILASDFEGSPSTTKFWHFSGNSAHRSKTDDRLGTMVQRMIQIPERIPLYQLLRHAVTDWDIYREWSLLADGYPSLAAALRLLPEEAVIQLIRNGKADEEALLQIVRAVRLGSPIRRAAKAALKGKAPRKAGAFLKENRR